LRAIFVTVKATCYGLRTTWECKWSSRWSTVWTGWSKAD